MTEDEKGPLNRWSIGEASWLLPGMGTSGKRCGDRLEGGGYHVCDNITCGCCYMRCIKRKAYRISTRLNSCSRSNELFRHITFSPPQSWAIERMTSLGGFNYLRREMSRVIRSAGIAEAVIFFHAWRFTKGFRGAMKNLAWESQDMWNYLREKDLLDREDDAIELGPHFHVLGAGHIEKADKFTERTGWAYRNHGQPQYTFYHMAKYALDHVGLLVDEDGNSRINTYTVTRSLYEGVDG